MTVSIKPYTDSKIAVSLYKGFTQSALDAVRKVSGRQWNSDNKIWLIPDTKEAVNQLLQNLYASGLFNIEENLSQTQKSTLPSSEEKYINSELKKLTEALTVRHYSEHTRLRYKNWVKDFLFINKNDLKNLNEQKINEYLKNLAIKKHVSASTQNQALAALLFYFRFIQNTPVAELGEVIHAKKKPRVPVVFSREEVCRVIENLNGQKQLIAKVLYGTGMRLNEALSLRILDVDFERNEIIIRHGKGDKDRRVMLPQKLIPE